MDRTQRLQQQDDNSDSFSSSSSYSFIQPIDDSDGYISDKDYVDHLILFSLSALIYLLYLLIFVYYY